MRDLPTFWLGRQPILDATGHTVAYELLFRSAKGAAPAARDDRQATASVITHAFNELGLATVLGDCRGFINFDETLLMSDAVELLPPERTVIELLETVRITPQITDRCRDLHSRGFAFALDDVVQLDDEHAPILPFVEVVKIDVLQSAAGALPELVRKARSAARVKLLAEKVDSGEQAERCRGFGFELFQGYFFARPSLLQGRRADPSKRILLDLLRQTLSDADNAAIVEIFKQAPELTYKLIRLVNSVGMGMRSSIQSLAHALVILGRRQLQRWLKVLIFADQSTGAGASPLLLMATARGKLMELLAERRSNEQSFSDRAFMTGILSLLDVLLHMPMAEIVEHLNLPQDVRAALLERGGALGHILKVVEALEGSDDAGVAALLARGDPCTAQALPELQIAALAWSNSVGASARAA
jgi:EAL and modified HD-GYP domain-containing signal transduction protein